MRIYLDFDGCLHRAGRDKVMFEHIDAVASILRDFPNVEVVISSSWREEHSFDEMRSYFADDVQHQVVGVTPVLPGATRCEEIMQHLRDTCFAGDYIVLDDDASEFPASWPPLSLCDPKRGFDVEKQDELRSLLRDLEKNILRDLSAGIISIIEATAKLGLPDAGHTLRKLREARMTMYRLAESELQAQSAASFEALRSSIVVVPEGERLEICRDIAAWVAHRAQKKNVSVDNYNLELHCLSRGMCTMGEWRWIVREAAVLRGMNERLQQQLKDEEGRLAEKIYELGKGQQMVWGRDGKIWKQTPAGSRGVYFVSLKNRI